MVKTFNTPNTSLRKVHTKDKYFLDQFKKVYNGFYKEPQSMKMLSVKLKIDRANICWYCRKLKKANKLEVHKRSICRITKQLVNFYTTNPMFFPKSNQTKLF